MRRCCALVYTGCPPTSCFQYWNTPGVDNSLYWLNDSQVANKVWNQEALPVQNGTAIVKDYSFNGKPTYQILKYEVWDIEFSY